MNLNDPALHLSAETIYASIYLTPRGELRSELISQLRRNHAKRMPRARGANRQSKLVNPVSIDQRDPVVGES
jgi:IS30 family transposase